MRAPSLCTGAEVAASELLERWFGYGILPGSGEGTQDGIAYQIHHSERDIEMRNAMAMSSPRRFALQDEGLLANGSNLGHALTSERDPLHAPGDLIESMKPRSVPSAHATKLQPSATDDIYCLDRGISPLTEATDRARLDSVILSVLGNDFRCDPCEMLDTLL
jgi:hypothetical protein